MDDSKYVEMPTDINGEPIYQDSFVSLKAWPTHVFLVCELILRARKNDNRPYWTLKLERVGYDRTANIFVPCPNTNHDLDVTVVPPDSWERINETVRELKLVSKHHADEIEHLVNRCRALATLGIRPETKDNASW